jgi:hypothetical protein
MKFYWFGLGIFGVWRTTHFLSAEDGPWSVSARLRRAVQYSFSASAFDCFYCLSIWVALPFALYIGDSIGEELCLCLALSGAAIALERLITQPDAIPPAIYFDDHDQRQNGGAPGAMDGLEGRVK